ncbi:MAG: valine--tRNA ligase [Acidobacteriota bacterium]
MSLEKAFDPETYEARVGKAWQDAGLFSAGTEVDQSVFSLVIPPPNVTGSLHVGHALDYTLQDLLIRWQRMNGAATVWVPGSDHAGIATQMVVERELKKERGLSRHELGREPFLAEVWRWKETYHARIVATLDRLGASCDWSRERFTMDPGFSRAVRETFVRFWEDGLMYRGERLINWCPSCRTALSDLEVDRDDPESGELWSFAYQVEGGGEIVVATTRPETMLGDSAVAVHPDDVRWQSLIGRRLLHPFFPDRDLRVIADPILADPEQGTGAVKVTPAHDPNDFACGRRHGLQEISIFNPDGTVNHSGGPFEGLDRFVARQRVKEQLTERGLTRGSKEHVYSPGRCQRCRTIVEPMISTQWFLKMEPLAAPAMDAVRDGRIRIVPASWEKTYFHWLDNIQDWCVSRQLWWGHRIPAWYCDECGTVSVLRNDPADCPHCHSSRLRQDEDVLDTWFSSQLWPFGVFGWPERTADLTRFYPTTTLVTGFDILFFWVARMIMAGLYLTGDAPFGTVLLHGMVRDAKGQKMSKSRGNALEPEEAMKEHGVDALRFTLAAMASPGSDVALSEERLTGYRAFMNKLWNATRFLLLRLPEERTRHRVSYAAEELDEIDRFLLASYVETVAAVHHSMADYRFDHAAEAIYHFLWHSYCDWSIELSKIDLSDQAPERRADVRRAVLFDVLDGALRLLHPIAPFITEELWQHLPRRAGDAKFLAVSRIPTLEKPGVPLPQAFDPAAERTRIEAWLVEPVRAARLLRTGAGLSPGVTITLRLRPRESADVPNALAFADRIGDLCRANPVTVVTEDPTGEAVRIQSLDHVDVIMPLSGVIDLTAERERLARERDKVAKELEVVRGKLHNPSFVDRAPAEVVSKERERLVGIEARLGEIERQLALFK